MDIDRFIVKNTAMWQRLDDLAARASKQSNQLAPQEVDELVALYQRTAAQLSHARTYYDDPGLNSRLTLLVATASASIYGQRARAGASLRRFFTETFPVAVYTSRRFIAAGAALLFIPMFAMTIWLTHSDRVLDSQLTRDEQRVYEQRARDYYSDEPAQQFATRVFINNIQVSFYAFALGVTLVGTVAILVFNGASVGPLAALFFRDGYGGEFLGLVLPHGLLELSSIVIAGAAGMQLGWAWLFPGDRRRSTAIAEEGRRSIVIVLGLMLCFVVAGFIEGFVTGSSLPTPARIGLGVAVELAFISWVVIRGRVAADAGLTGRFDEPSLADLRALEAATP
ncbi:MAG: hypothetical protein QOE63_1023 [Acidimicrobiaceae bacterium]